MSLTIDLTPEVEGRLADIARDRGMSTGDLIAFELAKLASLSAEDVTVQSTGDYLLRLAAQLRESAPDLSRDSEPTDHARHYKHYLYGTPKCSE